MAISSCLGFSPTSFSSETSSFFEMRPSPSMSYFLKKGCSSLPSRFLSFSSRNGAASGAAPFWWCDFASARIGPMIPDSVMCCTARRDEMVCKACVRGQRERGEGSRRRVRPPCVPPVCAVRRPQAARAAACVTLGRGTGTPLCRRAWLLSSCLTTAPSILSWWCPSPLCCIILTM